MTAAAWDIDGIVREVLRRLRDDATVSPTKPPAVPRHEPRTPVKETVARQADPRELTVADRVVSLEALDGRLAGVRRLVTRPDAVVTPSVRDELRTRRIELVRRDNSSTGSGTEKQVVLAVVRSSDGDGQVARSIAAVIGQADRIVADDLPTAVRRVADKITSGDAMGVLLTKEPVAAHCLANQIRGVRAAWAVDRRSVEQAIDTIGANLLVVAPGHTGATQTAELVRQVVAGGCRPCPSDFLEMLESVR
jgi:hypothetical protein